jgi:hypothetical protein
MKLLRKAYRFRMRPTKAQEASLYRMAGARRFVYNWALDRRKEHTRRRNEAARRRTDGEPKRSRRARQPSHGKHGSMKRESHRFSGWECQRPRCYTLTRVGSNPAGGAGVTMPALRVYVSFARVHGYLEGATRGIQKPGKNRREGQRAVPRVHDVRGPNRR